MPEEYDFVGEFNKSYKQWKSMFVRVNTTFGAEKIKFDSTLLILIDFDEIITHVYDNLPYYDNDTLLHLAVAIKGIADQVNNYLNTAFQDEEKATHELYTFLVDRQDDLRKITQYIRKDIELKKLKQKESQISDSLNESQQSTQAINDLLKQNEKQFIDFKNRYDPLLSELEAGYQSRRFDTTAKWNFRGAILYAILIGVLLIWLSCYLYNYILNGCFEFKCINQNSLVHLDKDISNKIVNLEIIKSIFYRLLIVSLSLYILKFLINNFKSSMHNYTVNSHRADSLSASAFLMDRTTSEETREKLLLQVANAIFAHQPTGYNDKDVENIGNINIVEKVIDKAAEKL